MKPVVTIATSKDLREIVRLIGELRSEVLLALGYGHIRFDPAVVATERAAFLDNRDYFIVIARSPRGHPLGFATVFEQRTQYEGSYGILAEIFVLPEYRRRGIGNALLSQIKTQARSCRWSRVEISLPPTDKIEAAIAFLDSKRFTNAGSNKRNLWL